MSLMHQGEGSVAVSFGESKAVIVRIECFLIECETASGDHDLFTGIRLWSIYANKLLWLFAFWNNHKKTSSP